MEALLVAVIAGGVISAAVHLIRRARDRSQEEREAAGKWIRAQLTSTQLSTYFVGYLELAALHEQAKRKAGESFHPRRFHDKLLSFGTLPPREVRSLLEQEGLA